MKTSFRWLFWGLLLVLVMGSLVSAKREVRWMQWKTSEVGQAVMDEIKATFEAENPDITLTIIDSPFTGFRDKAITLHRARHSPDVLMIQVDWLVEFAEMGVIQPLDPFVAKSDVLEEIFPIFKQKWKDNLYALPLHSGCVALFYNIDIFQKEGIAGPPTTWDEFVEIAKKVTKPEENQYAVTATLQLEPPTNLTYDIFPLIFQFGGEIFDEETNRVVFNSPEGVRAIEFYVDLINKHQIAVPGVLSNGEKEKRGNFAAGNIAMMFEGPWGIAIQQNLNPNLNFMTAPLPRGITDGTVVRGSLNTITTQAKDPDAAWKFIEFISGPVGNAIWSRHTGDFPARRDVAEMDFFRQNPMAQAFIEQMSRPNAGSPNLGLPESIRLNKILTSAIQSAVLGEKTVQQALDEAAAEWESVLAPYFQ